MPKETVYGDNRGADNGRPVAEVGWNRETGCVQIVTKCLSPLGDRLCADDGIHYTDGFYCDLDRRGINDLIRHLRRARDAAFGRDE